jgi:uncharacterized protein (TIGR02611 family)
MRAARRVVLETIGWLLVVGGIAALVLPGPGLLMLFGGMAILSQQYTWAERRLRPVEVRAFKTAADSVQTWPRIGLSTLGALVLVGAGVLWTVRPDVPGWWPLADRWWLLGGWPTGVTMTASGVIALALIVYSFRRFRGVEDTQRAAEMAADN